MASTYVNDLRLEEIGSGEQSGTWGDTTNTNLELIAEAFSFGTEAITTNADTHTTTIADGATDPGRSMFLKYTGTLDSACTITIGPNTVSKLWFIENGTSGSQNIIISQGSGANITIPAGQTKAIYSDGAGSGAAMVDAFATLNVVDLLVDDDLTVTDDVAIGGALAVTGDYSSTTSGTSNLRLGVNAGNSIASGGNYNTVVGDEAGTAITTGDNNTLIGYVAGDAISTSSGNTAVGSFAMTSMTEGADNVAVGTSALDIDTLGSKSVAVGRNALGGQNFTTATDSYNVVVGYDAGKAVTTGVRNVIIGGLAGDAITDADFNVAVGFQALGTNTVGSGSVAVGAEALHTQNPATAATMYNTAVGHNAGYAVTTGQRCTFVGALAGYSSSTMEDSVSIGNDAGKFATTSHSSVFVGADAGQGITGTKLTGNENTAVGAQAGLVLQGTANRNSLFGFGAGKAITTGYENLMVGVNAGDALTTGNNNIMIGMSVDADSVSQANAIVIGVGFQGAGNDFSFGKAANVVSNDFDTDANWSRSSDERLKKNITNQTLGLDFINDLRTVKYKWKANGELDASDSQLAHLRETDDDGNIINYMNTDATMHNFIAQEVKAALDTAGVSDFGGWKEDHYGVQQVSREMFVIPLVKAVQELSTKLDAALARIATLEG